MQCMHVRAKSAKNDLKPMDFVKHNVHFKTEGVIFESGGVQQPL